MLLFYPLILSHVIGDFLIQPLWLVRMKEKSHIGLFIHATLVSLLGLGITAALTARYGPPGYKASLLAAVIVFISHYLIDLTKVLSPKPPRLRLVALILDQSAHVIVTAAIAGYMPILFPPMINNGAAAGMVSADNWLNMASIFLYATFAGTIFVFEAGNTLTGRMDGKGIELRERFAGLIDRAVVAGLFLAGFFWVSPAYAGVRLFLEGRGRDRRYWTKQIFGYAFAAACGLALIPLRRW